MTKEEGRYKNRYRIESHRLREWDYSATGYYFVTIVTANRHHVFGKVDNNAMIFSEFGAIAHHEWLYSFDIRKELILDRFVVMPNHLHAIIIIEKSNNVNITYKRRGGDGGDGNGGGDGRDARPCVSTASTASAKQSNFIRKPKSISSFIAGYKSSVVTKIDGFIDNNNLKIKKYNKHNPLWQSNYHDHIIRNKESYQRITNYIIDNPAKWSEDSLHPEKQGAIDWIS